MGSCMVPVLAEIYLADVDFSLSWVLTDDYIFCLCRYIDGLIMLVKTDYNNDLEEIAKYILQCFDVTATKLNFTFEMPDKGALQFLGLKLVFDDSKHLCWSYSPHTIAF